MGGVDSQTGIGGDHKGADIEGSARLVGHPVGVHLHQSLDRLYEQLLGDRRNAQAVTGVGHTPGVVGGPEELYAAVGSPIGLQPFKDLLGIVEHHGGGVQHKGAIGNDAGVVPALSGVIVEQEHVIGKNLAKPQSFGVGLFLELGGALDFDLLHGGCLPKRYLIRGYYSSIATLTQ